MSFFQPESLAETMGWQPEQSHWRARLLHSPLLRSAVSEGHVYENEFLLVTDHAALAHHATLKSMKASPWLGQSGEGLTVDALQPQRIPCFLLGVVSASSK